MSADNVRATDAELADVLRLDGEATPGPLTVSEESEGVWLVDNERFNVATVPAKIDADFIVIARALFPRIARELMALREQHRAADEALTRCGFPPRGASDTLAERVARLVEAETTGGGEP